MSMIDDLNGLKEEASDLQLQQREIEADAFQVMRERPTYFGLKLLFGINHSVKEVKEEPEPIVRDEATPIPAAA